MGIVRGIVVLWVVASALGCAGSHQELVDGSITPDPAIAQELNEHVAAAKRMLNDGDLATATILLEQALRLDPTSKSALALQAQLEKTQRRAQEQARRELISQYEREGLKILDSGDTGRALAYFQAAQAMDPTNRQTVQLVQRAYDTQHKLLTKQRAEAFKERLHQAKGAEPSVSAADTQLATLVATTTTPPIQPPQLEAPVPAPETMPAGPVSPERLAEHPSPLVVDYTIQPEDVLEITVYDESDLTTKARVASTGEIVFPLLGQVSVAGLTATQVQQKLTTLLAEDYLVDPQVQVFADTDTYHSRKVFVTGAVNKPGSYPIPAERPTSLIEAIAMAGGFSAEAAPNGTRIVRVEQGQEKTIPVRANDIMKKGDKSQDVAVRPNDIVFVPESFF